MADKHNVGSVDFWQRFYDLADVLEKQTTGADDVTWMALNGEHGKSFLGYVRELFENFGHLPRFRTLDALQQNDVDFANGEPGAVELNDGSYALVADDIDDNNGIYIKEGGAWVKSKYDFFNIIKKHIDRVDDADYLDIFIDNEDLVYRFTDKNGGLHIPNLPIPNQSLQKNLLNIDDRAKKSPTHNADSLLHVLTDNADQAYAYFDRDANLHLANDVYVANDRLTTIKHVSDSLTNSRTLTQMTMQSVLVTQLPEINTLTNIAINEDDGNYITKRMPAAIKTNDGILGFYHQKIPGGDGDYTGSELWKFTATIDDNYNFTVTSKELFLSPDVVPQGIVKHPMLCRLPDNRILLMYEKRGLTEDIKYIKYQMYSDDDGLTWTEPTLVNFTNNTPSGAANEILGTTGNILLLDNKTLLVPIYDLNGLCYCASSDDLGATWTYGYPVSDFKGHEPAVIERFDGSILMDTRPVSTNNSVRAKAVSYDKGLTWQKFEYDELDSAVNQGGLFKDAAIGLIINSHNNNTVNERNEYTLSLSFDNGQTYPFRYQPLRAKQYGGYSHIIKYENGVYLVFIEYDDGDFTEQSINRYENVAVIILTISEVMKNVSYN